MAVPRVFRRGDCRLCDSLDLVLVMSLGETPLANAFLRKDQLDEPEPRFPLDLFLCRSCGHLQLRDVVDPELLFRRYLYVSSTSPVFVEHFRKYAEDIITGYHVARDSMVIEIGSNDGILLRPFQGAGMRVLGIDPAVDIARKAGEDGIETWPCFFTEELARRVRAERGPAAVVAANNVFAHADDLHGIVRGVKHLIEPGGIFVFEVSYLLDVYEKALFDMTYHEHLAYHSVKPLKRFLARHGMELIETVRVPTHGGSLRGVAQVAGGPHALQGSVAELVCRETEARLDQPETFLGFARGIARLKNELRGLLLDLRSKGNRIAGFGAPAKLTTLMHHFEIGSDLIEFVVDDSPLKQGLYTPGHRIPIVSSSRLYESRPDYVLILAWNFAENIMGAHTAFARQGGRFIIPLPKLEVW